LDASLAGLSDVERGEAGAFLQGVADGDKLMENLNQLDLTPNAAFDNSAHPKVVAPVDVDWIVGAKVKILTPTQERLDDLKDKWEKETKKDVGAGLVKLSRGGIDKSVANLSSITMLVEVDGKTFLLTDGLAEHMLKTWASLNMDKTPIDVMKVPHHGSSANNSKAFFEMFPAKHYVFCANGKHDNPDMWTLEKLFEARAGESFTVHMTATKDNKGTKEQTKYLETQAQASGGKVKIVYRDPEALSISVTP
jgi:hypothetical protein